MEKIHELVHRLSNPNLGLLFVRIALGCSFISEGWMKINNLADLSNFFMSLGIPVALAYFVAYAEFIGGIFLIAGLFVRYIGIIFSVIMIVAIAKVHYVNGFSLLHGGYEYVFVLLMSSLALVVSGSGICSLKSLLKK